MICSTCRQPNPDEAPTCCGCGVALPSTAASPPVTSAVLDNRSITGGQWIRTRFVPIVLGAVIVGALLGMARGAMNAVFFGIQGMLVGGFIREPFLSVTRSGSASGAMTGTWWIIFTVVDAALLLFLFVGGSAAGLGDAERPAAPESPARTSSARNAAVAVAVLIAAGAALYAYAPWRQQENPYSLENAKRIRQLAGQWKMDGGHGVFADTDEELRFSLKAVGYNTLVGAPAGGGRYRMSIDQGDDYRGMPETIVSVALGVIPSGSENRSTHCKSKLSTRRNCIAWPDSGPSSVYTNSPKRPLRCGRCFRT